MYYYQFHIGDYLKATSHLSLEEDIAYRRLLDMYYDTEAPIPTDIPVVSRRLRVGSDIVKIVLEEFFEYTEEGYRNSRADAEIKEYHAFIDRQRNNGKLGGRPKKTQAKPTANPNETQVKPKKTLTNNHKPITNIELPDWLPEVHWNDFVEFRKFIKKPMTDKAMHLMISKLQRFKDAGHNPIEALNRSIANNWSDVYEPKGNAASNSKSTPHLKYWEKGYQP